jgi:hypothetical protein
MEQRRVRRDKVKCSASIRETGSGAFEVELADISPLGFRMVTFARPGDGTHIWVKLPGLRSLEAVVRHSDGNVHGCEFIQPLHPAVSDHLVREWG